MRSAPFWVFLLLLAAPNAARAGDPSSEPDADDPLLSPPTPPARVVASWGEAWRQVEANSPDLRIAYDQAEEAAGQARVALAACLPSVVAQGSFIHTSTSNSSAEVLPTGSAIYGSSNYAQVNLQVQQSIVDVAAWTATSAARRNVEAARLASADRERTLALDLASVILSVVTAERLAEVDRAALQRALGLEALAETRARLGGGTRADVARARGEADAAREAVIDADEAVREARVALGLSLGSSEPVGVARDAALAGTMRDALPRCTLGDTIESRADVVAAKKRAEAAAGTVNQERERFLPTLSAQANFSAGTFDTPGVPNTFWDLEAMLTVPIWDGGARYGSLRRAHALADESEQQLAAVRRRARAEVAQAQGSLVAARRALEVVRDAETQAERVLHVNEEAYRSGQGTSLDLITAAAAVRQASLNVTVHEYLVARGRITTELALASCR